MLRRIRLLIMNNYIKIDTYSSPKGNTNRLQLLNCDIIGVIYEIPINTSRYTRLHPLRK